MASVKPIMGCLGIDTSGTVSVLGDFFGFIRARVPADPDTTVTAQVSVLAHVVRNISDPDFVGKSSDIPGECDKEAKDDGVVAGEIGRGSEGFSRTFAHEIGHHLGLSHNHGGDPDCPDTAAGCNNLMAQTRCATSCGGGARAAVLLTGSQGSTMRSHCAVQDGC
jgi:hypothetical protein